MHTVHTELPGTGPDRETLIDLILKSVDDDGATDVVEIDLRGKSAEADTMVIATGRSTRHVGAISEKLIDRLKQNSGIRPHAEGLEAADWVLIDAGDVIVHIFRPEVREFYQLEKMWTPAPEATARAAAQV
ncbi:MAG: ribosome silencing factor [Pseudomonadota bacterium]